jgi:hypothetical protein
MTDEALSPFVRIKRLVLILLSGYSQS